MISPQATVATLWEGSPLTRMATSMELPPRVEQMATAVSGGLRRKAVVSGQWPTTTRDFDKNTPSQQLFGERRITMKIAKQDFTGNGRAGLLGAAIALTFSVPFTKCDTSTPGGFSLTLPIWGSRRGHFRWAE